MMSVMLGLLHNQGVQAALAVLFARVMMLALPALQKSSLVLHLMDIVKAAGPDVVKIAQSANAIRIGEAHPDAPQ